MASMPDPASSPTGNSSQPINERAARLLAEMEELGRRLADAMRESRNLIGEMSSKEPPPLNPA